MSGHEPRRVGRSRWGEEHPEFSSGRPDKCRGKVDSCWRGYHCFHIRRHSLYCLVVSISIGYGAPNLEHSICVDYSVPGDLISGLVDAIGSPAESTYLVKGADYQCCQSHFDRTCFALHSFPSCIASHCFRVSPVASSRSIPNG